jgi:hypothetical protein
MTVSKNKMEAAPDIWYLELGVPVLAFGSVLTGILTWKMGYAINFAYFSIGCVLASFLLAYLAWIRPKKDIVAVTTPIYAIIFFFVPNDFSGVLLQLLYAVSLTFLLIRLKYRFGSPRTSRKHDLPEAVSRYVERVKVSLPSLTKAQAQQAEEIFTFFARGDYRDAALMAEAARKDTTGTDALIRAYDIITEQAIHLEQSLEIPENFVQFLPCHVPVLAREIPGGTDTHKFSSATLDCALLLIFAAAWTGVPEDREQLKGFRDFTGKLIVG